MRRTDLLDTSLEMHRLQIKLLREKGPEWRIRRAFELTQASIELFPNQTRRSIAKRDRG